MSKKFGVLSEANKYNSNGRNLDNTTSALSSVTRAANDAFEGKYDDALIASLNDCKFRKCKVFCHKN